ncbi:metal-dependent hydrolase [Halococcus agarilyticus]|uniref:metal-dependent hydrolase n=1 Tax=Halococcus agarilyticus TaxID=1232219 RepID=UPI0006778A7B|nr:metal-dependent hydrolase [Halococcus agarilyticus]
MNKREHVINAVALSVGLAYLAHPTGDATTARAIVGYAVPVVLGALAPDIDTAFGSHRKTFHNLATLGVFVGYPLYFDNLELVWIGVATHFVLDLLGSKRGLALLYPLDSAEFDFPVGVRSGSRYATGVTLAVTAVELAIAAALVAEAPRRLLEDGLRAAGVF